MQDLRQQISEVAPNATAVIAAALGETTRSLRDAVEAGDVSTNRVIAALVNVVRVQGPGGGVVTYEFTSLDHFTVEGRGTVYVVPNPSDAVRGEWAHLVGQVVLIDGCVQRVAGVESFATPRVRAGLPIGLLVAPQSPPTERPTT